MYGEGKSIDRYRLTDYNGNKIDINSLNNYQRGVILNDCMAYFENRTFFNNSETPAGVMRIDESNVINIFKR